MTTARERSGKRKVADSDPESVVRLTLPDGTVETVAIRPRGLSIRERSMIRKATAGMDLDGEDFVVAFAWAIARRTHPDLDLADLLDVPLDELIEDASAADEDANSPEA